jgi:hypothetical protein
MRSMVGLVGDILVGLRSLVNLSVRDKPLLTD